MMQIESHNFSIIATEGSYVHPFLANTLYFMTGERYDFVVDTNHRPIQDYWIRFRLLDPCPQKLQGFAILRYHKKVVNGVHASVEFDQRVPPLFFIEYPNGTVRKLDDHD